MLDDEDGVALVDKRVEHPEQFSDVLEVKAGRRLIEDVDRAAGRTLLQLGGKFHPLGLASGKGRRRLPHANVAEADVDEGGEMAGDRGYRSKELQCLLDRHIEHLGDGLALEANLECLAVVSLADADFARHVDVWEEVHLDLQGAIAGAGLAPATLDIE